MHYSLFAKTRCNPKNHNMRKIFTLTSILLFLAVIHTHASTQDTLWHETFESDWTANWYVESGTWEVGEPTSGPENAYQGNKCAATVLGGNYSEPVDSRLIRHSKFIVPQASENPRLRFWHWYSFSTDDYGKVQIRVDGTDEWEDISTLYSNTSSNTWTYPFLDLSEYAGKSVQIAFYFHSNQAGQYYSNVSSGWYIDNIEIVTGDITFNNVEGWENGIGDWASEKGTWEIGTPTSGPSNVYNGQNCAATVLDGNYAEPVDSKLISPKITIPNASENPRLRFWHWYSFSTDDYGKVQIRVDGTDEWEDISPSYSNTGSSVWTYPFLDLSEYAGKSVQIAFYFHSNQAGQYYSNVSSGWYIDNIEIVTGDITFNNVEGWENGIGDWASEKGTWEIGTPTSGPSNVYNGQNCAATVLDGNYAEPVDSKLISPKITIPNASENPRLRFWHWYSFSTDDYGKVQIRVDGTDEWEDISTLYSNTSSNTWTYPFLDLSEYAGKSVQFAFYFHSNQAGQYYSNVASGWYIDDIIIGSDTPGSNETDILSFSFETPPQIGNASINPVNHTIEIQVTAGTDITDLVANFSLSNGAIVKIGDTEQVSGTSGNDFTNPLIYSVIAEDNTTKQDWAVTVSFATHITDLKTKTFTIYPNPVRDKLSIQFNNPDHSKYKLSVYTESGIKVLEKHNITSNRLELETNNLANGIYILKLWGEKTFQNKFIIMK